jgi:hypothetical protein
MAVLEEIAQSLVINSLVRDFEGSPSSPNRGAVIACSPYVCIGQQNLFADELVQIGEKIIASNSMCWTRKRERSQEHHSRPFHFPFSRGSLAERNMAAA